MTRHQRGTLLLDWIRQAEQDAPKPLRGFATYLRQDLDAVTAGLSLPWSSGIVEGHVNRVKTIKRPAAAPDQAHDPGAEGPACEPSAAGQQGRAVDWFRLGSLYRRRNEVERTINRLKGFRAVATRFDKRACVFHGTVTVAAIWLWLRQ